MGSSFTSPPTNRVAVESRHANSLVLQIAMESLDGRDEVRRKIILFCKFAVLPITRCIICADAITKYDVVHLFHKMKLMQCKEIGEKKAHFYKTPTDQLINNEP
ncbi:hypothetical protein Y032_0625g795 [Ancylostoma ceylanicum]|uniref:Uncharacterized protein n=1 Tax=Ancylostoma ceylanicum TaxID=53326 RepID=A0A016WKR1_9BILA|nr:hypothetical protein Y032_0625g795 [Ancylostoma ceylanicum]